MSFRLSSVVSGRVFVSSPFCCQPVALPSAPSFQRVVRGVRRDAAGRAGEVAALLEKLPAHCDRAKREMLSAQYASRYYRSRYGRGIEARRKQMRGIAELSDDDVRLWARGKCLAVRNPLAP